MVYYSGNYSTFVRTKSENEVNQMKAYHKQQEEIAHIKKFVPYQIRLVKLLMAVRLGSLPALVHTQI